MWLFLDNVPIVICTNSVPIPILRPKFDGLLFAIVANKTRYYVH